MSKKVTWVSVYGPHTQVKCLLKALIFGTCKKNKLQSKICEKCLKRVTWVGVYGSHTEVKCLLKN